jgi:transposase
VAKAANIVARATGHLDFIGAPTKQYQRIATRYDKTDQSFKGMTNLAATAIALK